jgi:Flp pilus assembly protein TadG
MIISRRSPVTTNEHGQSLSELALFLTLLFILLAGVVDIGRAFFTYITLRDAAQEGALYASYEPTDCGGAVARAKETTKAEGSVISPVDLQNDVNVNVSCIVDKPCAATESYGGGEAQIIVTYSNFPVTMPFLGTLIGSQTFEISASSTNDVISPMCTY